VAVSHLFHLLAPQAVLVVDDWTYLPVEVSPGGGKWCGWGPWSGIRMVMMTTRTARLPRRD
jgi:hypothetical protein